MTCEHKTKLCWNKMGPHTHNNECENECECMSCNARGARHVDHRQIFSLHHEQNGNLSNTPRNASFFIPAIALWITNYIEPFSWERESPRAHILVHIIINPFIKMRLYSSRHFSQLEQQHNQHTNLQWFTNRKSNKCLSLLHSHSFAIPRMIHEDERPKIESQTNIEPNYHL